jgi:hypothetical protein
MLSTEPGERAIYISSTLYTLLHIIVSCYVLHLIEGFSILDY